MHLAKWPSDISLMILLPEIASQKNILHWWLFFFLTVPDDYSCIMCNDQVLETRDHLFFRCKFASACWRYICPGWNIPQSSSHLECIEQLKQMIQKPFFMEIVILAVWAIWKTRNAYIFQHVTPSLYRTKTLFKEEFKWIKFREIKLHS
jgi:hypothetical protein